MWSCWANTTPRRGIEHLAGKTYMNCLITDGSKKEMLASC
jgi:hypothetical protein